MNNPFAPGTNRHEAYQSVIDRVEMSEGTSGVSGAAHEPDTRDMQRAMDPELMADVEARIDRKESDHKIWLSQLSCRARKRLGIIS